MKTLSSLLKEIDFQLKGQSDLSTLVDKVSSDSRQIKKGDLFVAVKGFNQDGHRFITKAIERGAVAVVLETPVNADLAVPQVIVKDTRQILPRLISASFDFPEQKIKGIGVTGTNGKTTTTFLLQYLLNCKSKAGLIGTVFYDDGSSRTPADNTTPIPETLFMLLNQMTLNGLSYYVMEVSSHALDQNRTNGLIFSSAVFTNLTQDHLDYHLNFENYYQAKKKLFTSQPQPAHLIINLDDPYGSRLSQELNSKCVATFGIKSEAHYQANQIKLSLDGIEFELKARGRKILIKTPLTLIHNVYNVLAALVVLTEEGFSLEEIIPYLAHFPGVPGRMERIDLGQKFHVFVDYAHTPDAILNVLSSVQHLKRGRIISVFGCGGDRDRTKRPVMGEIASRLSDVVIITTDNQRTEQPMAIIEEIKKGIHGSSARIQIEPDRETAIGQAIEMADEGDLVFIFGKGHEDYQIIGQEKIHFSDREVAKKFITDKCSPLKKLPKFVTEN